MLTYNTEIPILFIVFNRPDFTMQVFEQIKKVCPRKLYIAADGPRSSEDTDLCAQVRSITNCIDWDCAVNTLFHEHNLGCRMAGTTAISWFFDNEPQGIIIEDDCLPADSFFGFCSAMLEKYQYDERIGHISGGNYQRGVIRGDGSYYFSALTHVGGWAGWRRVWKDYDISMKTFPQFETFRYLDYLPSHNVFKNYWNYFFQLFHTTDSNGWDFQYAYLNLINNRLSIIPNVNLITNIGYNSQGATHFVKNHPFANLPTMEIDAIVHPSFVICDTEADIYSQSYELNTPVGQEGEQESYHFIKDKLLSIIPYASNSKALMKIPRIIHQVYEDPEGPSEVLLKLSETWKKYHPAWEYRFWNKEAIDDFLMKNFAEFIPRYRSFPFDVQRWDAIRYLILYHFGGLYVDLDYECLEPIDALLYESTCCMGLEPAKNAVQYGKSFIVGNALMATIPGHNYFKKIIEDISDINQQLPQNKSLQIIESTGPFMTTRVYNAYPDQSEITLLPAELIAPLTLDEVYNMVNGYGTSEMDAKVDKAFALHYFFGSWLPQTI